MDPYMVSFCDGFVFQCGDLCLSVEHESWRAWDQLDSCRHSKSEK